MEAFCVTSYCSLVSRFWKLCLILLYARSPVRTHNEVLKAAEINMAVAMG
ncbi:MAG: hypothetical protein ACLR0U_04835 [Enterocloster clostridioformis]